jgi:hypothetical protein
MQKASNLEEALRYFDPRPLDFSPEANPQGESVASSGALYATPPGEKRDGRGLPAPIERLRKRLLGETPSTKLFLSGHVGSGKSTELNRLAADATITERFDVVSFRFEEEEWAVLDSSQVMFRIAAELFGKHKDRLGKLGHWQKIFGVVNERIFTPVGWKLEGGSTSVEVNLAFVKLRQELKYSSRMRKAFREYGETKQSALRELIEELVDHIEEALVKEEDPRRLLLLVDDLDKLRKDEQHRDIFGTNLGELLAPPVRILYTVPTAVRFADDARAEIRQNAEDLFPVRVIQRKPETWNAEAAYTGERIGFFETVVGLRAQPGLIHPEAIRLAAIYAGGVLRDFFRLLREGVLLADYNGLKELDPMAMHHAVVEERRRESIGLYTPDYEALVHIHKTNALRTVEDRKYMSLARVIECWNGKVFFDAHPLLWSILGEHEKATHGQPLA